MKEETNCIQCDITFIKCDIKIFFYLYKDNYHKHYDGLYYFFMKSPSGKCRMICMPLVKIDEKDTNMKMEYLSMFIPIRIIENQLSFGNGNDQEKIALYYIKLKDNYGQNTFNTNYLQSNLQDAITENKISSVLKLITEFNENRITVLDASLGLTGLSSKSCAGLNVNNPNISEYMMIDLSESDMYVMKEQMINFGDFYSAINNLCRDYTYWDERGIFLFSEEDSLTKFNFLNNFFFNQTIN
jgi:hypothetical protein